MPYKSDMRRIDGEIDGTNGTGGRKLGCANCHHYYDPWVKRGNREMRLSYDQTGQEDLYAVSSC